MVVLLLLGNSGIISQYLQPRLAFMPNFTVNYGVNIKGSVYTDQHRHSLQSEVQISVAIMQKIARYISHKANGDFLHIDKALELG